MTDFIDASNWIVCPEGTTPQFDSFLLRSCADDLYRTPIVITFLALQCLLILYVFFSLFSQGKNLRLSGLRNRIIIVAVIGSIARLVNIILLYFKLFSPAPYIFHGISVSMVYSMGALIMYAWCEAYNSMLISSRQKIMKLYRNFMVGFVAFYSFYAITIPGGFIWMTDNFVIRNYLILSISFFVIISMPVVGGLQFMIHTTFMQALKESGLKNHSKLDTAIRKLRNFSKFIAQTVVSVTLATVAVLIWMVVTDFVADYFVIVYFGYFILVEQFSVVLILWITKKKLDNPLDNSSSLGNTSSKANELTTVESGITVSSSIDN